MKIRYVLAVFDDAATDLFSAETETPFGAFMVGHHLTIDSDVPPRVITDVEHLCYEHEGTMVYKVLLTTAVEAPQLVR